MNKGRKERGKKGKKKGRRETKMVGREGRKIKQNLSQKQLKSFWPHPSLYAPPQEKAFFVALSEAH